MLPLGQAVLLPTRLVCFHLKSCVSSRSKLHYCQPDWFQGLFVAWLLGSSCWWEFTCFRCKSRASVGSKLHYCQPGWFQSFSVAWLLIWSDLLSPQELCVHWIQAALLPARLVSEVLCGLAHHADKKCLASITRAVLPWGPSLTIASQPGSRGSLWLGSSCWQEAACFQCKSCASTRSKLQYCQPECFQH